MINLRGKQFIKDVVIKFLSCGNKESNIFDALYKIQAKNKKILLDTRILDFAIRYKNVGVITDKEFVNIFNAFIDEKIIFIKKELSERLDAFKDKLIALNQEELGEDIIKENIEKETNKICTVLQFFGD